MEGSSDSRGLSSDADQFSELIAKYEAGEVTMAELKAGIEGANSAAMQAVRSKTYKALAGGSQQHRGSGGAPGGPRM